MQKPGKTSRKPAGFALTLQKPEAGGNPPRTYQNPAKPGGTRRNPADLTATETRQNPAGNKVWTIPKVILPTTPLQLTFFPPGSARFPPGSAGFLFRVPPGSSARFRRVPLGLGSGAPPGSATFRWVPGFRKVSSVVPSFSGFPPTRLLLPTRPAIYCQDCARFLKFLPGVCQGCGNQRSVFWQLPGHCPSRFFEKITKNMASLVE